MYYLVGFGISVAAVPVAWLLPVVGTFCIGALAGYFATAFALLVAGVGLLTAHVIGLMVAASVGIACIGRRLPLIFASAFAGSRLRPTRSCRAMRASRT
ncbi:hypothetical protein SDRG_11190 [Saprolegnia diclina VS20]|uniref:Uncharacterized protein n=1 Tax=Saprolegnia diclina (strain VS20) TaxID=1156394 RepID=T0RFD7_SAPDV|nr:hypothetical protein SDRG_11190 [Saprolegnia diclina VS20]EQC31003.1 hypothetical protein SDRG_11190 [Saprolegnia diclina VS20]|eukprot:XP_008615442.1 hypothetical protein SDRG_11190 [Saprolegnia diclina VS20]